MISSIAAVLANGQAFDLKNYAERSAMSIPADLSIPVNHLFDLLAQRQIPYLLVGGVAMLCYVEGRNTQDIDLLIDPIALAQLPELVIHSQDKNFARASFNLIQVDLLLTSNPLFKRVLSEYSSIWEMPDRPIQCSTPAGLVLLKLYALPSLYRQGEFQRANLYESDITALLIQFPALGEQVNDLLILLRSHLLASDLASLAEIVTDIRRRVQRFH
jgi:hypothetical protein